MLDPSIHVKYFRPAFSVVLVVLGSIFIIVAATSAIRYHELVVFFGILSYFFGLIIWVIEYRNRPEVRKRIEKRQRTKFLIR